MEKHHLRFRHFWAIIILWNVFIFTRALDEKLRIITLVIAGPMSHVATQQITFDIHQEPRTGPATSSPQYHCFTFQLMEDNVPMPSLDTVSISKPFYKSWTSQAEVNQHHSLLAHLISLLFFCRVNTIRWRCLANPGNLQGSSPASGVKMLSLTRHLPWMSIRIIATECGSWCSLLKVKYFAR